MSCTPNDQVEALKSSVNQVISTYVTSPDRANSYYVNEGELSSTSQIVEFITSESTSVDSGLSLDPVFQPVGNTNDVSIEIPFDIDVKDIALNQYILFEELVFELWKFVITNAVNQISPSGAVMFDESMLDDIYEDVFMYVPPSIYNTAPNSLRSKITLIKIPKDLFPVTTADPNVVCTFFGPPHHLHIATEPDAFSKTVIDDGERIQVDFKQYTSVYVDHDDRFEKILFDLS